ncbi:hypothetical protein [Ruegeria arenilitoris]|uniref:hypothetical protein n=1 Tax=Ruegeria arenilitoris TaxID=1173585 RepID=UPI00147CF1A0|nr:hypothetical protein [Ruegeria arenilitoris]
MTVKLKSDAERAAERLSLLNGRIKVPQKGWKPEPMKLQPQINPHAWFGRKDTRGLKK